METSKQKTVTFEFSTTDIVPEEMANTFIRNIVVGEYNPMKKAGMRIRFWPKTGSGALHFKLREILKRLLNEDYR